MLKTAVVEIIPRYKPGDKIQLQLLTRYKESSIVQLFIPPTESDEIELHESNMAAGLPLWHSPESRFNRLSITYDNQEILDQESNQLQEAMALAKSSQEDSLPFLQKAWRLQQEKKFRSDSNKEQNKRLFELTKTMKQQKHPSCDLYYFYQASDGQYLFLHPMNVKYLLKEVNHYHKLPRILESKVIDIVENINQDEKTRKRYRYLSHLPLTCAFNFCIIDMTKLLSKENLALFNNDVKHREDHLREIQQQNEIPETRLFDDLKNSFVNTQHNFPTITQANEHITDLTDISNFPTIATANTTVDNAQTNAQTNFTDTLPTTTNNNPNTTTTTTANTSTNITTTNTTFTGTLSPSETPKPQTLYSDILNNKSKKKEEKVTILRQHTNKRGKKKHTRMWILSTDHKLS